MFVKLHADLLHSAFLDSLAVDVIWAGNTSDQHEPQFGQQYSV